MIFNQNLAIYTVSYKESESEVKKCKVLEPGGENKKKLCKTYFFYFPPWVLNFCIFDLRFGFLITNCRYSQLGMSKIPNCEK